MGLSVCLSVCLSHISPLERLFVLKTLSRTQQATKVKGFLCSIAEIQHSLCCTASVQCEGTHSLGIGFSRFKKANHRLKATWNTSQCETATYLFLSAALVSVPCPAIFCIRPVTRTCTCSSLRLLPGYILYASSAIRYKCISLARALSLRRM